MKGKKGKFRGMGRGGLLAVLLLIVAVSLATSTDVFAKKKSTAKKSSTATTTAAKPASPAREPVRQMEIKFVKDYEEVWSDRNGGAEMDVSVWRVKPPDGYVALGDVAVAGYPMPDFKVPVIKDDPELLARPVDYEKIWDNYMQDFPASCREAQVILWMPVAPPGYKALGAVVSLGDQKPDKDLVRCVRIRPDGKTNDIYKYVDDAGEFSEFAGLIWNSMAGYRGLRVGLWSPARKVDKTIDGRTVVPTGTFLIGRGMELPTQVPMSLLVAYDDLKANNVVAAEAERDALYDKKLPAIEDKASSDFYAKGKKDQDSNSKRLRDAAAKEKDAEEAALLKKQEQENQKEAGNIKVQSSKDSSSSQYDKLKNKKDIGLVELVDFYIKWQLEQDPESVSDGIDAILSSPQLQILKLKNAKAEETKAAGITIAYTFTGDLYLWGNNLGNAKVSLETAGLVLGHRVTAPPVAMGPLTITDGGKGGPRVGIAYALNLGKPVPPSTKKKFKASFEEFYIDGKTQLFKTYLDAYIDFKDISRLICDLEGNLADRFGVKIGSKVSVAMLLDPKKFEDMGMYGEIYQSFMDDIKNEVKKLGDGANDDEIEVAGLPTSVSVKDILDNFQWPLDISRARFEVTTKKIMTGNIPGIDYKGTVFGEPVSVKGDINLDDITGGKFTAAKEFFAKLWDQAYKEGEKLAKEIEKAAAPLVKEAEKIVNAVAETVDALTKDVSDYAVEAAGVAESIGDATVKTAEDAWDTVESASKTVSNWFDSLFVKKKKKKPSKPPKQQTWQKPYFYSSDRYIRFDMAANTADERYPRDRNSELWPGIPGGKVPVIDAAFSWGDSHGYFFVGDQYYRYNIDKDEVDDGYPKKIKDHWKGVPFDRIDAAFYAEGKGKVYFFRGDEYIGYFKKEDKADGVPRKIKDAWRGVPFSRIDAAVSWTKTKGPGNEKRRKVYFFSCDEYVRYDMDSDMVDPGYPKKIRGNWNNFKFKRVDAAMDGFYNPSGGHEPTAQP